MKSVWLVTAGVILMAWSLKGAPTITERGATTQTFNRENVLGTSFEMKVAAANAQAAGKAETAAIDEIARLCAILSSWDPQSEFSRWFATRGQAVKLSPELYDVLAAFDTWRVRTGGALDAAAETVTRVWKQAAAQGRLPDASEKAEAAAAVKLRHWQLDPVTHSAVHLSGAPLAMNSFVKSFVMDRAVDRALATPGVTGVVMNIGGDLVIRGDWTEAVEIADPSAAAENGPRLDRLRIENLAVATSGGYRRGFEIGGRHYSHIVDPRTGDSAGHVLSATVIAADPSAAGAMATAFCVLRPEESEHVAASVPGAEYLLVLESGERIESPGWGRYRAAAPPSTVDAKGAGAAAVPAAAMELTVSFELAQPGGMARRPYVAVWIEDSDRFPVRTLALWFQKDRWLPDLRSWYRDDRMRAMAEGQEIVASVASATRPSGKYTLKWDGKDQQGKAVKPGKYTVLIEAAREHGTYQLMRQELEFDDKAKQFQLPGNQEISSASIDFRKAAH